MTLYALVLMHQVVLIINSFVRGRHYRRSMREVARMDFAHAYIELNLKKVTFRANFMGTALLIFCACVITF